MTLPRVSGQRFQTRQQPQQPQRQPQEPSVEAVVVVRRRHGHRLLREEVATALLGPQPTVVAVALRLDVEALLQLRELHWLVRQLVKWVI
jgi:hypothetical protein